LQPSRKFALAKLPFESVAAANKIMPTLDVDETAIIAMAGGATPKIGSISKGNQFYDLRGHD
jgi:hypothetical protein